MLDPQKLQILLEALGRAPISKAEQIIIQEVVDQLIALTQASGVGSATPIPQPLSPIPQAENGASAQPLPRQQLVPEQ
jgi:hypothetical protein